MRQNDDIRTHPGFGPLWREAALVSVLPTTFLTTEKTKAGLKNITKNFVRENTGRKGQLVVSCRAAINCDASLSLSVDHCLL